MSQKFFAFLGGVTASMVFCTALSLIVEGRAFHFDPALLTSSALVGAVNAAVLCIADEFRSRAGKLVLGNGIAVATIFLAIGLFTRFGPHGDGTFNGLHTLVQALFGTLLMFLFGAVIGLGFRAPWLIGRKLRGQVV